MNIDWDDFDKSEVIGSGLFGTSYLLIFNNVDYVLKVQKIFKNQKKKDMKIPFWRELKFYDVIKKKVPKEYQKFFMKLIKYRFKENCKHIQKRTFVPNNPELKKHLKELDKSNTCLEMLVEYKGYTLGNIMHYYTPNKNQILSLILQLCISEKILRKINYLHNDMHVNNIAVKKSNEKFIQIKHKKKKHKFPLHGLQLSLIDYGNLVNLNDSSNKNFNANKEQIFLFEIIPVIINDLCFGNAQFIRSCNKKKKKLPWIKDPNFTYNFLVKILKNEHKIWKKMRAKIHKVFPLMEFYLFRFENNPTIEQYKQIDSFFTGYAGIDSIINFFRFYYPKKYVKYMGWCSDHKPLVSRKIIKKILYTNNLDDLISYLLKIIK